MTEKKMHRTAKDLGNFPPFCNFYLLTWDLPLIGVMLCLLLGNLQHLVMQSFIRKSRTVHKVSQPWQWAWSISIICLKLMFPKGFLPYLSLWELVIHGNTPFPPYYVYGLTQNNRQTDTVSVSLHLLFQMFLKRWRASSKRLVWLSSLITML